jgi:hypothetical protein
MVRSEILSIKYYEESWSQYVDFGEYCWNYAPVLPMYLSVPHQRNKILGIRRQPFLLILIEHVLPIYLFLSLSSKDMAIRAIQTTYLKWNEVCGS